jgi:hypothetical protein
MTAISKISHLTATGTRPDELGQSAWNQCRGGNLVGYRMPNQPRHRMKDGPHCQSGVEFSVRPQTASSCRVSRLSEKPSPIRRLRINAAPTLTALFDAPDHMLNGASIDNVERRARRVKDDAGLRARLVTAYRFVAENAQAITAFVFVCGGGKHSARVRLRRSGSIRCAH